MKDWHKYQAVFLSIVFILTYLSFAVVSKSDSESMTYGIFSMFLIFFFTILFLISVVVLIQIIIFVIRNILKPKQLLIKTYKFSKELAIFKISLIRKLSLKKIALLLMIFYIIFQFNNLNQDKSRLEERISLLENKLGGADSLSCDESEIKNILSERIVRIIGSYGEGSGFAINDKQILTSFHVIDGDPSPKVVFKSGKVEQPLEITGNRDSDIALLRINTNEFLGVFPRPDRELKFGETVYAGGYALGSDLTGDITVSKGIYSGVRYQDNIGINTLQTDISLVEGMSGGPLVTACGEVIGVNTAGVAGLSLFVDYQTASNQFNNFTDEDVSKIVIDTSTPVGVVEAFYNHIRTKDLLKAYRLISDERLDGKTTREWREGYEQTLYVELHLIKVDEANPNKVHVRFTSGDWIDETIVYRDFEGYWITTPDDDGYLLNESNITEVIEPEWNWYWDWEEPDW